MQMLFAPDQPTALDMAWVVERLARSRQHIWVLSEEILARGQDVVLELGLLRSTDRHQMVEKVQQAGHAVRLYFADAPLAVRKQRVAQRNVQQGQTYSFQITPPMFDFIETLFEAPSRWELAHSTLQEKDYTNA